MEQIERLKGMAVALDPQHISGKKILLSKQTAIIQSVNIKSGKAIVAFEDGSIDAVELSRLIILKPYNEILRKLIRNWSLPTEDFQTMVAVSNFYRKGLYLEAMNLALTKYSIREICTTNCEIWLDIKKNQKSSKGKKSTPKS